VNRWTHFPTFGSLLICPRSSSERAGEFCSGEDSVTEERSSKKEGSSRPSYCKGGGFGEARGWQTPFVRDGKPNFPCDQSRKGGGQKRKDSNQKHVSVGRGGGWDLEKTVRVRFYPLQRCGIKDRQ